jgi:nucleoside-diphosphate-sugar epimerase
VNVGCSSSDKVALVTGATGFTGGHLVRALQDRGYRVRALVRDSAKAPRLLDRGVEVVSGDLVHAADVSRAAQGCSCIYHIAALYRSARHPNQAYYDVNVRGTQYVLDAADRHHVDRVVHCSTVGVHGEIKSIPADENAPFAPGDIYQESKLAGELLAKEAFESGLRGSIFRPVGIYGPGDTRFLKLFKTVHNGRFRMFGSGEVLYHLTYIDDLVDGILRCGEKVESLGQTYILAGPRYTTVAELVRLTGQAVDRPRQVRGWPVWPLKAAASTCEAVCKPLGIEPPLHRRRLDFFLKDRAFTSGKAARELGYAPQVDLPDGLRRTAEWYFAKGYLKSRAAPAPHAVGGAR